MYEYWLFCHWWTSHISHCILTFRCVVLVFDWWQVQAVAGVSTVWQVTLHQAAPHNWLLPSHGTNDGETRLPGPGHSHPHLSLSSSHCAPIPSILLPNLFRTSLYLSCLVILFFMNHHIRFHRNSYLELGLFYYFHDINVNILSILHRQ